MSHLCRHCQTVLTTRFLDLGHAPPSGKFLKPEDLSRPETSFPLRLWACSNCRLVQTESFAEADAHFAAEFAHFSSNSRSWLDHAATYSDMITKRLGLTRDSHVIEVASNDGYLLKNFVAANIPCLGIEPTRATAKTAIDLGVPVLQEFFGEEMAASLDPADLIIANNVYADVPDINDFTRGLYLALKPQGVITLEFSHLMRLVEFNQFDTVHHEHFSYLSLFAVEQIMAACDLRVFDVEELTTHDGSLRIYACRTDARHVRAQVVNDLAAEERARGMDTDAFYIDFQTAANSVKNDFVQFLITAQGDGKTVAAYGAAAKGNTLLNYAGIKPDLLPFVCDAARSKIGRFLPGSHIPILAPEALDRARPDYIIILPWHITGEIRTQNAHLAEQGTQFVTVVPRIEIS
ncbi:MAG: class I SAM-dependent methyltransferase [Sedimentitalea sp.]